MDDLRLLKARQHANARSLLADFLGNPGVRLPIASSFLRFANPEVFQIIDRHACRATYGTSLEAAVKKLSVQKQIDLYFSYLIQLRKLGQEKRFPSEKPTGFSSSSTEGKTRRLRR